MLLIKSYCLSHLTNFTANIYIREKLGINIGQGGRFEETCKFGGTI